jgi:hypothetical protein
MFLDIIHRPVFIYKHHPHYYSTHKVSETGSCLRLQVKPTQNKVFETLRFEKYTGRCILISTGRWTMSRNTIFVTICDFNRKISAVFIYVFYSD